MTRCGGGRSSYSDAPRRHPPSGAPKLNVYGLHARRLDVLALEVLLRRVVARCETDETSRIAHIYVYIYIYAQLYTYNIYIYIYIYIYICYIYYMYV